MKKIFEYLQNQLMEKTNYNVLIFDDSGLNLELYKMVVEHNTFTDISGKLIESWSEKNENHYLLNNLIYCNDYTKIDKIIEENNVNIVILDVIIKDYKFDNVDDEEQNKYGGISIYKKIRNKYKNIEIHFITALTNNFILQFDLHVPDGIRQPIIFQRTNYDLINMFFYLKNYIKQHININLLSNTTKFINKFFNTQSLLFFIFDNNGNIIETNTSFNDEYVNISNIKSLLTTRIKEEEIDDKLNDIFTYDDNIIEGFGVTSKLKQINSYLCILDANTSISSYNYKYNTLKNKFDNILNSINDLIWTKDLKGNYTYTNNVMNDKILHASYELESLNKNIDFFNLNEMFNDADLIDIKKMDDFVIKNKLKIQKTFCSISNNVYNIIKKPLLDFSGKLIGITGVATDITKEYNTNTILSSVFNNTSDITILHTDTDLQLIYWNKNLTNLSIIKNMTDSPPLNEPYDQLKLTDILSYSVCEKIISSIESKNDLIDFIWNEGSNIYSILISKTYVSGKLSGYTMFIINKNTEILIKNSFDGVAEILQQQIEKSNNMVIIFDKNKNVFLSNNNFRRTFSNVLNLSIRKGQSYDWCITELNLRINTIKLLHNDMILYDVNDLINYNTLHDGDIIEFEIDWDDKLIQCEMINTTNTQFKYFKLFVEIYTVSDELEYFKLEINDITQIKLNEFNLRIEIEKQKKLLIELNEVRNIK